MQLTDQELWHIFQVEPPATPPPREPGGPTEPWREWIEWAKTEVLSGVGEISPSRDKVEQCSVYLARLVRLLDDLAEGGIARETGLRRENGGTLYEEGYVKALLGNGWEACGYAAGRVENTLRMATQDGLLIANDYDDWRAGMASGSGVRTYYGLTFKGKKQAEIASTMWLFCDEASEEIGQGCGLERVAAERTEAPKTEQTEGNVEVPPPTGDTMPEMTPEERKTAGLGVLMLLAQTYYTLLESAISMATWCTALDMQLNESYLWTVKNLSNLLDNHKGLEDFPMKFEPACPDLFPNSVCALDWQDMVAPDAERFLSTVQKYVMDKGFRGPEEGTLAWAFIELFQPAVKLAIENGNAYRKQMEEYCRKQFRGGPAGTGGGRASTQTAKSPEEVTHDESAMPSAATKQTAQPLARPDESAGPTSSRTQRSPFIGDTSYVGVPLAQILNDLRDWVQSTKQSCTFLQKRKEDLLQARSEVPQEYYDQEFRIQWREWERRVSENELSPDMIEMTKPFLPKYSDVEAFLGKMIKYYEVCVLEFERLLKELPRGVKASHPLALIHILQRHDRLNGICREFRTDYVRFGPWTEMAHEIYVEVSETQGNLLDLGNVAMRLEALVGTALEEAGAKPDRSISGDDLAKHTARIIEKVEAQPMKTAALLRETIKQRLGTIGTVVEEDFTASPHFTNLTWRGNQYVLRGTAAVIIETLYIAQKYYGIPGFHQDEVFAQVYGHNKKDWPSSNTRIQNYFRKGDAKRLWDACCIAHDGKGNFHLNIKIHT